jgi:hypothetical protein
VTALDTVLAFLQGKGLTPAQAAGVAGNLQVESNFNPGAHNDKEGAIGIAQWEGGRRTNLQHYAAATGGSETDLSTQLGFLWSELTGPESGALSKLEQTSDPGSAAAVFDQYYERSSGSSRSTRVADAQAIAAGKPTSTGSSSTSSSSSSSGGSVASSMGGLFGWEGAAFTIGLKILGAAAAAGLVIVGALHTVSDK